MTHMAGGYLSTDLGDVVGVAIDLETTSMDAADARIVEIGARRVGANSTTRAESTFSRRVNPQLPIDPGSTAVHGISDADVAGAPPLAAIAGDLTTFLGDRVLIGHNISYDLAVLEHEFARIGHDWRMPHCIDVRNLARIVSPGLANYGLRALEEWLALPAGPRTSALDDAAATERILLALVPHLRARGIRTLGEADAALRRLFDEDARTAGGLDRTAAAKPSAALATIDGFPYRHRVHEVMSTPPVMTAPETTLGEAVRLLIERKVSSVLVGNGSAAEHLGIVTERDVLRALGDHGPDALRVPLREIMHRPLQTVRADDFVYRAIGRMERLGLRHLAVTDAHGQVVGAVTTRNLLRHRATRAIALGDEIDRATSAAEMAEAWKKLAPMARSLAAEDVDPRTITAVISSEICALTRRACELAEARMAEQGWGKPPVRYAMMVLGSAGRGESLMAADQDNAIVYAQGEPGGREDEWFAELGRQVADTLDEVGVRYCDGGVMARNAEWRRSVAGWKATIDGWVRRQRPQDLLNTDIFFDGIPVHGDAALAEEIWAHAYARGHAARDFVKLLSEMARDWHAPLTFFGGIRTDGGGRVDLKKGGLMPIFTSARVLSIRHDVRARATPDRLRGVADKGIGSRRDIEQLIEAHRTILGTMLRQQLADEAAGIKLSPNVEIGKLDKDALGDLKDALGRIGVASDLVGEGRM